MDIAENFCRTLLRRRFLPQHDGQAPADPNPPDPDIVPPPMEIPPTDLAPALTQPPNMPEPQPPPVKAGRNV